MTTAVAPSKNELAIAADLRIITQELANVFIERREPIEVILTGVLAKAHTFILGPPGTAKSALIAALCQRFPGAQYFRVLMDKQLPKDDLFGSIDIAAYEKGDGWVRDYQGTAATAHLAFFDEVGKAGPASLNPLLTLWEERMHKPGKTWEPAPLLSAIGASNESIENEEGLQATWDRFLLRIEINYIQEPANFIKLLRSKIQNRSGALTSPTSNKFTTVPLDALMYVIDEVIPFIPVPDVIFERMAQLRTELRQAEIIPGDRRWALCVRLLQASAFLNGRTQVEDDDLLILKHTLWTRTDERETVTEKVTALGSPIAKVAMELTKSLDELEKAMADHRAESRKDKASYGGDAMYESNQIRDALADAMADAQSKGRSTAPLESVDAQLKNVQFTIFTEYLRMDEDRVKQQLGIS